MPPSTRASRRRTVLENLPLDPRVLTQLMQYLQCHQGDDYWTLLENMRKVCKVWKHWAERSEHLEEYPEAVVGELRAGDRPYRFDRPHDATFLPNGDVLVADCDNFRLHVIDRYGCYVRDLKLGGTSCPTGVTVAPAGSSHVFVVEHGSHIVSRRRTAGSAAGAVICTAGGWGCGDGELRHPWGVATLFDSMVLVTDSGNDRCCVFSTSELAYCCSFGSRGSAAGQLLDPRGICVSGDEIYICDAGNHRVQVFAASTALRGGAEGKPAHFKPARTIGGGKSGLPGRFDTPSGVAVHGDTLCASQAHRLSSPPHMPPPPRSRALRRPPLPTHPAALRVAGTWRSS